MRWRPLEHIRLFTFLAALLLASCAPVSALAGADQLSLEEFRSLAEEVAGKVDLFRDAWRLDPRAEFYGGTTRDYVYWLKRQFREAKTREDALEVARRLRARPQIDVKEFIMGESDVDVVTRRELKLEGADYSVRKIDDVKPDIFDPLTEAGRNELEQGHIPAEKIRLGKQGFIEWKPMGDGFRELYENKLTLSLSPPEVFARTIYASQMENHPVLLALRYLRLQASNYYNTYGSGYPVKSRLLDAMDGASARQIRAIIRKAADGRELREYLKSPRFRSWANGTTHKAFRSYTNPTAALMLWEEFGADKLIAAYKELDPINQLVFVRPPADPAVIRSHLRKLGVTEEELLLKPSEAFADGYYYHGTRDDNAFRNIIYQGVIPSDNGAAGPGLYGVPKESISTALDYARGRKENIVRFKVRDDARIANVIRGPGERAFDRFRDLFPGSGEKEFADYLDLDIVKYPYGARGAFVASNAGALGDPEGVYRQLMSLSDAVELAGKAKTPEEIERLLQTVEVNRFKRQEERKIFGALSLGNVERVTLFDSLKDIDTMRALARNVLPKEAALKAFARIREDHRFAFLEVLAAKYPEDADFLGRFMNPSVLASLKRIVEKRPTQSEEAVVLIGKLGSRSLEAQGYLLKLMGDAKMKFDTRAEAATGLSHLKAPNPAVLRAALELVRGDALAHSHDYRQQKLGKAALVLLEKFGVGDVAASKVLLDKIVTGKLYPYSNEIPHAFGIIAGEDGFKKALIQAFEHEEPEYWTQIGFINYAKERSELIGDRRVLAAVAKLAARAERTGTLAGYVFELFQRLKAATEKEHLPLVEFLKRGIETEEIMEILAKLKPKSRVFGDALIDRLASSHFSNHSEELDLKRADLMSAAGLDDPRFAARIIDGIRNGKSGMNNELFYEVLFRGRSPAAFKYAAEVIGKAESRDYDADRLIRAYGRHKYRVPELDEAIESCASRAQQWKREELRKFLKKKSGYAGCRGRFAAVAARAK